MQKPELKRVNLFMEKDIVDVLDAFAAMNQRSRTYVIHELLRPAMPALRELLAMPEKLTLLSDADRLAALAKLNQTEEKLTNTTRNMPKHLEGVTK